MTPQDVLREIMRQRATAPRATTITLDSASAILLEGLGVNDWMTIGNLDREEAERFVEHLTNKHIIDLTFHRLEFEIVPDELGRQTETIIQVS